MGSNEGKIIVIMIDESGWGSLIGGVAVGIYNTYEEKAFAKIRGLTAIED